jgi:hypothetical protein
LLVSLALRERLRRLHEAAAAVGILVEIHVLSLRRIPNAPFMPMSLGPDPTRHGRTCSGHQRL